VGSFPPYFRFFQAQESPVVDASKAPKKRHKLTVFPESRNAKIRATLVIGLALFLPACGLYRIVGMPGSSYEGALPAMSSQQQAIEKGLRAHVTALAQTIGERNHKRPKKYQAALAYIKGQLQAHGYKVELQEFKAYKNIAKNIVIEIPGKVGPLAKEILIVGGHYDSVSGCPGANDNASGTAGVIELARIFKGRQFDRTVRFVAFANEEPPYFQRHGMGSFVYAKQCAERKEKIVGMLSLETIGYYSDKEGSQKYPFPFNLFYPSKGDFIAFVGDSSSRTFVRSSIDSFRRHSSFPSEGVAAPAHIAGIGWSDHWSFWQYGFPGVMVTDTAPFRYAHYHTAGDTVDKLDFEKMARVVYGVGKVVEELVSKKGGS
jgi:hypothetical protein